MFRKCPKTRKCNKPGCESTHNVLLRGAEKVFSVRSTNKELNISNNTSHSNSNSTAPPNRNKPQTSSSNVAGSSSNKKLMGLLPVLRLEIKSHTGLTTALVKCDSCCTLSWVLAKPVVHNYSDVEMILGQDVFHAIKPLEYFQGENQKTPVAVRVPIGWVLSDPLPSPIGVRATIFKCNVEMVRARIVWHV